MTRAGERFHRRRALGALALTSALLHSAACSGVATGPDNDASVGADAGAGSDGSGPADAGTTTDATTDGVAPADGSADRADADGSPSTDGGSDDAEGPDATADADRLDAHGDVDGGRGDATDGDASLTCLPAQKACGGTCVAADDPAFGCRPGTCAPCSLAFATATCADDAGSRDAATAPGTGTSSPAACAIAACVGSHADCNKSPDDGCESDLASDPKNCGRCGVDCSLNLHHASPVCTPTAQCDYTACDPGYLDVDGNRLNGCETPDPAATPEVKAGQLLLRLLANDFDPTTKVWPDRSGHHADATCSLQCPPKGRDALQMDNGYFTISNPNGLFDGGFVPTIFMEVTGTFGEPGGTMMNLGVTVGGLPNHTGLHFCGSTGCMDTTSLGDLFTNNRAVVVAALDATGQGRAWMNVSAATLAGPETAQLGALPVAHRVGTIGFFSGTISEVFVFTGTVSDGTRWVISNYLATRYSY